jgi:hypothetical protein
MQKPLGLLEKIFKYLGAALLIIIPLYPKFPFIRVPMTYVSIRIEDFLMVILAFFVLLKLVPKIKIYLKDKIIISIFLFLLVGLVSLLSANFITKTILPHIAILHFIRRIEYFIPFFAGYLMFQGSKDYKNTLEFLLKSLMIVVFIAFIYGFGQRYFGFPVIITQDQEYSKGVALRWTPGSHLSSTFAGHYDLASFLVLVLPILVVLFFTLEDKLQKVLVGIVFASGLWLLVGTISRISIVSYLLAVSFALFFVRKYKPIVIVAILSIIIFGSSMNLLGRYLNLKNLFSYVVPPVYAQESPKSVAQPVIEDRSTSIRLNAEWPRAVRAFLKNPLLGTGYSSISLATDNDYLRLLGEIGLLGFFGFLLIIVRMGNLFVRIRSKIGSFNKIEQAMIAGTAGGLLGTLLNATFIDVFEASKFAIIFWFLIGISVYLIKNKLNEQNI